MRRCVTANGENPLGVEVFADRPALAASKMPLPITLGRGLELLWVGASGVGASGAPVMANGENPPDVEVLADRSALAASKIVHGQLSVITAMHRLFWHAQ